MHSGCKDAPTEEDDAMSEFNAILGIEKASALDSLVQIFHEYVSKEFPEHKTLEAQTEAYLRKLFHNLENEQDITPLKSDVSSRVLRILDDSGLRKELVLCDGESSERNPVIALFFDSLEQSIIEARVPSGNLDAITLDSEFESDSLSEAYLDSVFTPYSVSYHPVHYGHFRCALGKAFWNEPICQDYLEASISAGDLSPLLIIQGILNSNTKDKLQHPVWQRIIATEIFLWHIDWGSYCQDRFP